MKALLQRLHELGYSEERNLIFEYRSAEGRRERLGPLAMEQSGSWTWLFSDMRGSRRETKTSPARLPSCRRPAAATSIGRRLRVRRPIGPSWPRRSAGL